MKNKAFSLVELSIVLVILGLLVGGILAGQSLIRAAEIRSVSTDLARFATATYTFRDKYFALPGDMTNATSFWNELNPTASTCRTTPSTGTATCNGDGNRLIESWRAPASMENFRFWQHLANAGLLEGTYTGVTGPDHASEDATLSVNVPASRVGTAGYAINPLGSIASSAHYFLGNYGNTIQFGKDATSMYGPVIKPEEAWNIDTKMDDGSPAMGRVRGWQMGSTIVPGCTTANDTTALYALSSTGQLCSLIFITGF